MFEGEVFIVTGASGALGAAVIADLLAHGARVAAVDVPERLAALQAQLAPHAGRAVAVALAPPLPEAWCQAYGQLAALGPVRGAVLIAGGWAGGKPFHESTEQGFRSMLDANLETAAAALRAILPGLVRDGQGSVVVIGSRAVERPWESGGAAAYAASKAALVTLAQTIAAEVRDSGVRVNAILPSTLDTPANRAAMPAVDASRWVSLESLSGVVRFLLSGAARDISGAALPVYGRA